MNVMILEKNYNIYRMIEIVLTNNIVSIPLFVAIANLSDPNEGKWKTSYKFYFIFMVNFGEGTRFAKWRLT